MSKANSFKSEPWTALEKGSYSVFEDDFISDKLTFKFTKKSPTSTVAIKQAFTLPRESKQLKSDDEIKFWFPVKNRTLYFRLKNDSYKVHVDNGVIEREGYKFNLYGSAQGKRSFGGDNYKLGLEIAHNDWSTNFRAGYKPSELGVTIYNKSSYARNGWNFGFLNAFQLTGAKNWVHSALQVAYKDANGNDYYIRANAGKKYQIVKPENYINNVTFDYIYNYTPSTRLGVETKIAVDKISDVLSNTSFVWDHKCESQANTGIKVKADLQRNIAVSIKNNIEGYGNYLFGINVNDFGGANRFSYGVQLDLNL